MSAPVGAGDPARAVTGLVLAGAALLTFEAGLLRVALPVIQADLATGIAGIQLVSLAGLVVVAATLVVFGRLADVLGAGRVFGAGLVGVTVGSLLAAAAPTLPLLVAALAVQGLGWSMSAGSGPALLVAAVPHEVRGRVLAGYHMAVAVGLGLGPAAGGILVERAGWRAGLALTGVLAAALAWAVLLRATDRQGPEPRPRFDAAGAALLAAGLAGVLLLLQGGGPGRGAWLWPATVLAFAAFGVVELRSDEPVLDLRLFRSRAFCAGLAASFLDFIAMAANMFLMPFLLQDLRGLSVGMAGALMAVVPAMILLAAPLAGSMTDRTGPRLPATLGMAGVTAGVALMALLGPGTPLAAIVAVLAVYGLGAAFFQSPNITAVLSAAPDNQTGVASGTLSTVARLGQVAGIAVAGAAWDAGLARHGSSPAGATAAFSEAFLLLAAFGVLATVASWLRGRMPASAPAAAAVDGARSS